MDRQELSRELLEMAEYETGEKYTDLDESADLRLGLKLDSLDMVSLVLQIENRLKIEVRSDEIQGLSRVGDLLDLLEAKLKAKGALQAA
jgi:acyl carrier protein